MRSFNGWLRGSVAMSVLGLTACTSTAVPSASPHPMAQGRRKQPCASEGFSCKPGPCCHGLKCVDDVCRKPSKD